MIALRSLVPRVFAASLACAAGLAAWASAAVAAPPQGSPQTLQPPAAAKGVGATFPQPAYARWATLYAAEAGETVTYDGAGSGAGLASIRDAAVAFGASDEPLDEAALRYDALVQVPTLVGGVVAVVNVPGVGPGDLVLDGQTLADLFEGRVRFWDDAAIARLNPHLPLDHLAVTPVRRQDASGTTAVFAAYLAAASTHDAAYLGQHPPTLRPLGSAAVGNRGVAGTVAGTPGAIGYVGFDFAQERRLPYVDLVNPAGRVVQPTLASIEAAAGSADWTGAMTPSLIAGPGAASWPIVSPTYVLMRRINADAPSARAAVGFLAWASRFGGPAAEDLGFVPLPEAASAAVRRRLREVGDTSGQPLVAQP